MSENRLPLGLPELPTTPTATQYAGKRQGQESNISGRLCEEAIERAFVHRGIPVFHYSYAVKADDIFEPRRLIKHVPYRSIYNARSRSEFVYEHGRDISVRIECRSQTLPGSVDEKFPYLLRNMAEKMPEPCIWLVIDGCGARDKSILWVRAEIKRLSHLKTIRLYTPIEAQRSIKRLVEEGIG